MRTLMKKVVAGILAGIIMMTSAVSAGAESEIYSAEDSTVFSDSGVKNKIQEYIENVMSHYLLSLEHYGSFRMTDLIPVYNWDGQDIEKYLIVVADNTKMIGTACVEYNNGEILSSFREENITLLYSLLIDNSPFQLG